MNPEKHSEECECQSCLDAWLADIARMAGAKSVRFTGKRCRNPGCVPSPHPDHTGTLVSGLDELLGELDRREKIRQCPECGGYGWPTAFDGCETCRGDALPNEEPPHA